MEKATEIFEKHWTKVTGKPLDETTKHHMKYAIEAINEALLLGAVRQSLPSDVYTELDIDKAYKCGERQSTFYKKNGTVILPRNYEGIDG